MNSKETKTPAGPGATFPNRVLVVDANRDAADTTVLLLNTVGFEAKACYRGEQALREAQSYRPHLCFIDLNMPGMDGDELAIRLKSQAWRREIVLVALTAMTSEECRERISRAPFSLHLVKPVEPFQLVRVVDEVFRAWSGAGSERRPALHESGDS